ncbi:MAG TPA: o-succinylbenzoate synthase, partial [Limnochordales bacterium]
IRASVEETVQAVEQAAGEGYLRVKLKIRPGWDVAVVQAVRQRLPAVALAVDANGTYGPGDLPVLRALDDMGLAYIEQPLAWDDLDEHAWLQQQLRTAVVLDESIPSARHAGRALALRACRAINIKPGRMGGHLEAVRAHHVAEAFRVPVLCGGMLESGVGRAHNLHLATLPQFTWPADMSGSNRYWQHDIVQPELQAHQGWIPLPPGPGTGVALDADRLRRVLVERRTVRP